MITSVRGPATAAALVASLLVSACGPGQGAAPAATPSDAGLPPSATPSASAAPSDPLPDDPATSTPNRGNPTAGQTTRPGSATSGAGGVFSGTRQVLLLPRNSEATLGVVGGGKAGLSSRFDDNDLFVLTPTAPGAGTYLIRTAKIRSGGEALCLSAELGAGGKPAAVLTKRCDAGASGQRFSFRRTGESNGRPTYTIRTGRDTYVIQDPTGDIAGTGTGIAAVTIGEGTADIDTPFVIADRGAASLPALD